MKNFSQLFAFLFILFTFSCTKPPNYTDAPVIEFLSLSQPTIKQGMGVSLDNAVWINIGYTDGDGDIGVDSTEGKQLFIIDTHFNSPDTTEVSVPFVPEQGAGNGISGEISVATFETCCIYQIPGFENCGVYEGYPTDTLIYEIYLFDRAGNESNHIFTDPIIILCE